MKHALLPCVVLLVAMIPLLAGCGREGVGIAPVVVKRASIVKRAVASGFVECRRETQVNTQLGGFVRKLHAKLGQRVEAGDPIAEVWPTLTERELLSAERSLQSAVEGEEAVAAHGEALRGDSWFPPLEAKGTVAARVVADGPDEDYGKLRWTLLAALAAARTSIRIVTPYFLPDAALVAALNVAILRGVEVEILLPDRSNLPFVHEASRAMWWQILERGCRLWLSPPPFDHSKLLLVDAAWAFVGSANWDPRSLRLNFEFNLECYDPTMGEQLGAWIAERQANAREVTLAEADGREFGQRLWDGTARLLTPFL